MKSTEGENPWQVPSFDQFLFYCCPECDTKIKELNVFFKHAVKMHKRAKDVLYPSDSPTTESSDDPLAVDTAHLKEQNQDQDHLGTEFIQPPFVHKSKDIEMDIVDELKQEVCEEVINIVIVPEDNKRRSDQIEKVSSTKRSCGIKCPACQNILHPSLFEKHKKICQESIADKFDPLDIVKDSENEEKPLS